MPTKRHNPNKREFPAKGIIFAFSLGIVLAVNVLLFAPIFSPENLQGSTDPSSQHQDSLDASGSSDFAAGEEPPELSREEKIDLIKQHLVELGIEDKLVAGANIATQTAWVFRDGEIIWETPIVTANGEKEPYYDTPVGVYEVHNKLTDHELYGNERCDYWIGFNAEWEEGFHDAQWRDEFGGDIYIDNGSKGCINTPLEAMTELFGLMELGDIVWVHNDENLL